MIKGCHHLTPRVGNESSYFTEVHKLNENIPENLILIAGDPSLEVQAEAINQIAGLSLPKEAWKNVHSWLKDMTDTISAVYPDSTVFIDCNPSFAAYTELSIVAADKIILPCTADGSSARAIDNVGQLVYGTRVPKSYENAMFSSRLQKEQLRPPPIHLVLLNRSTQYNKKASKAFSAMFDAIKDRVHKLFADEPMANGTLPDRAFHEIP